MLFTLAAVIFFTSIAVFFSQEIIGSIKKLLAIRWANLLVPLAVGSWVFFVFNYWILWSIYYLRVGIHADLMFIANLVPFKDLALDIAQVLFLTLISVVPVIIMDLISRKKTYHPYRFPYITSTIIWIVAAILMILTETR